ncbi:filamentous hemagglutinin N-terminal domain-containing protein [Phormidium sp. LEGE 05292]|uniref:two-partner secretion domain-containing protein n=1 Tax=[Phormidium] sp. LEGE 05292 TaxID=767427 RepID=UPI001882905B|nr:filamentous hemagglutinin N-terminal domain-containing protein [Phormidium sp. LEGE 05292]MBE9228952.1 filamentous hemagglutinin N-terminal domain-containing protein [Phormidium sp. LEGE 05292]
MKKQNYYFWITGLLSLCYLLKTDVTQAQISSDGTLSTQVQTTNNLNFTINNGNRVGNNLFHSFREFSVPTGGSATFANDVDVKNIFSRVTGSSISNIDGLLKTNGSANLFLINPNGIIFGSNAQLNIGGSFVASTASKLLFADGTQFSATNTQTPPLLTVSVPVGLQFGQTAQPIQIEGSKLEVVPGNTLAMLGGDVLIKGSNLRASAGRIELGSVAGDSFVSLTPITEGFALGYENVLNFQDIQAQESFIRTSGEGNGAMQLQGRRIAIADGSRIGGNTVGEKAGQPLVIRASESVEVNSSFIVCLADTGTGTGSDIIIETKRLLVEAGNDLGIIETTTGSSGRGGNLTVNASESIEMLGQQGSFASLRVRTYGQEEDAAAGDAGTLQVSTRRLILRNGGEISTSTLGEGRGGTLIVNASEFIEASGRSVVGGRLDSPSGLRSESRNPDILTVTGRGGNIIVNTQRLVVQDGATVSVASINGSLGQAGSLEVNASDSVTVSGTGINAKGQVVPSSLLATSEGSGGAGELRVNTPKLTIRDGAAVSVNNTGSGTTGDLQITANNLLLDRGKLTAETTGGQGNINLHAGNIILRRGSQITTNATGSNITGSNITINTDVLTALENSDISANSQDFRGGNVQINASGIFGTQFRNANTPLSDITATGANSQLNGIVQINTPDVDPAAGLVELTADVVDTTRLIATGCPANRGNSFTVTGRGGLPALPSEPLRPNNTVSVDWVTGNSQEQRTISSTTNYPPPTTKKNPEIVEATSWVRNNQGQVVLISSTPNVTASSNLFVKPSCR